jgi:glyoxylase-like metal-dependent hydrolase (beta-lactamase superfamily II)
MNNLLKIGDINITGLSDGPNVIDPTILFPETPLEAWEPYYDIFPEFFHGKHFKVNLGTFVISNNDASIVVDTGLGPHGDMFGTSVPGELIQDFKKNNISFESIDKVFLTHLHGDHYGWNYREDLDDRPPTFPNAKYMVNRLDWDHWLSEKMLSDDPDDSLRRSVLPLLDDGLLDLMEGDTNLTKGVQAIHTPGHTPGHMSLLISSGNERAMLLGDVVGSPMQITESNYPYMPDSDPELGRKTRHELINKVHDEKLIAIGSHLSYPGWGTIITWKGKKFFKGL